MNLYPVDPLANGHPPKLSAKPLDSGLLATLKVSWIIGATQLLAELACFAAALAVYLPSGVSTDAPFLLNYLHLWIYLGQGLYLVSKERSWAGEWSSHKKPWWRLGIAVLGWPMHLTLVTFHQKVHRFDNQQPADNMTVDWLRENLTFSFLGAAGIWFFGMGMAVMIVSVFGRILGVF